MQPVKKLLQKIIRGPIGPNLFALYLRCVFYTSRKSYYCDAPDDLCAGNGPCIYANWHGNNFIFPFYFRGKPKPNGLVAMHADGQVMGRAMAKFGVKLIHGSGSTGKSVPAKQGARAFIQMLRCLKGGETVVMSADVPKVAREVGNGIITLARKSGAPIVPAVFASSRRRVLKNWDQTQIHLPFSHITYLLGEPLIVPDDDTDLEIHRLRLERAMNELQAKAFRLADNT